MDITVQCHEHMLVLRVDGDRIDAASAIRFKERMRELIRLPGDPIILDLSHVNFLDSSGLGALVSVMKLLEKPRKMELSGLTSHVMKVFRLTRMDSIFVLHPDVPDLGGGYQNKAGYETSAAAPSREVRNAG
jgi:anti-sigma B factor antagonist